MKRKVDELQKCFVRKRCPVRISKHSPMAMCRTENFWEFERHMFRSPSDVYLHARIKAPFRYESTSGELLSLPVHNSLCISVIKIIMEHPYVANVPVIISGTYKSKYYVNLVVFTHRGLSFSPCLTDDIFFKCFRCII
jgi:hypothetical protein